MRLLVKIGSSSLTNQQGILDVERLFKYVDALANSHSQSNEIILVTSGAVSAGMQQLNFKERPTLTADLQATASVGQAQLIWQYQRAFATNNITIGQVLLTRAVFGKEREENVISTIEKLLSLKAIPIVNENDSVSTEELTFGDNDQLAAKLAVLMKVDRLILLTDTPGLFNKPPENPNAKLIEEVRGINELRRLENEITIAGSSSKVGKGGMETKLKSATIALENSIPTTLTCSDNITVALNPDREIRLNSQKCTEFYID